MPPCLSFHGGTKPWSRQNGWSLPLHPLQFLAWFFIIIFIVIYIGTLIPSLPFGAWQISGYTIGGFIFLFHIVIHLVSISLNPADYNVRAKRFKGPVPTFDRSKHSHVIENQFCYICEVKVGPRSKHCSACNKCVADFDHHCKWLNNCIGGRNYWLFITCVTSALVGCLLIFAVSVSVTIAYFDEKSWLYLTLETRAENSSISFSGQNFTANFSNIPATIPLHYANTSVENFFNIFIPVSSSVWFSVVIVTVILSLLGSALLGHLIGFHIFLMYFKLSTYDYIVQKRERASASPSTPSDQQISSSRQKCHSCLMWTVPKKVNQISPALQNGSVGKKDAEFELNAKPQNQEIEKTQSKIAENGQIKNSSHLVSSKCQYYKEPLPAIGTSFHSGSVLPKDQDIPSDKSEKEIQVDNRSKTSEQIVTTETLPPVHVPVRRSCHSPSTSFLAPIMEAEVAVNTQFNTPLSEKHRSVSQLSLDSASPEDCNNDQLGAIDTMGDKGSSGSLSNLFVLANEDNECEQNEKPHSTDDMEVVYIVPSPIFQRKNINCLNDTGVLAINTTETCKHTYIESPIPSPTESHAISIHSENLETHTPVCKERLTRSKSEDNFTAYTDYVFKRRSSDVRWNKQAPCPDISYQKSPVSSLVSVEDIEDRDELSSMFKLKTYPQGLHRSAVSYPDAIQSMKKKWIY